MGAEKSGPTLKLIAMAKKKKPRRAVETCSGNARGGKGGEGATGRKKNTNTSVGIFENYERTRKIREIKNDRHFEKKLQANNRKNRRSKQKGFQVDPWCVHKKVQERERVDQKYE